MTREEREEEHELGRMRDGYFHRWVDDVDTSRDIPYLKPMALVEDFEDGKMHLVDYLKSAERIIKWNKKYLSNKKLLRILPCQIFHLT